MAARVKLWREDYPYFAADPVAMVHKLDPLKPLVGKDTLAAWLSMANAGQIDALFESVMTLHYDPCYLRSTAKHFGKGGETTSVALTVLDGPTFSEAVRRMAAGLGD